MEHPEYLWRCAGCSGMSGAVRGNQGTRNWSGFAPFWLADCWAEPIKMVTGCILGTFLLLQRQLPAIIYNPSLLSPNHFIAMLLPTTTKTSSGGSQTLFPATAAHQDRRTGRDSVFAFLRRLRLAFCSQAPTDHGSKGAQVTKPVPASTCCQLSGLG